MANRKTSGGGLLTSEAEEVTLDPTQVVVKGADKAPQEELEEGEAVEDEEEDTPVLTAGISSALARLFDHHRLEVPRQILMS